MIKTEIVAVKYVCVIAMCLTASTKIILCIPLVQSWNVPFLLVDSLCDYYVFNYIYKANSCFSLLQAWNDPFLLVHGLHDCDMCSTLTTKNYCAFSVSMKCSFSVGGW